MLICVGGQNQNPELAMTLLNDNLSPTSTESNSSTLTSSVTRHTKVQARNLKSMRVEPSRTSNLPNMQPMGVLTVNLPAPTVYSTMIITSQHYIPVSSLSIRSLCFAYINSRHT